MEGFEEVTSPERDTHIGAARSHYRPKRLCECHSKWILSREIIQLLNGKRYVEAKDQQRYKKG